MRDPGVVLGEVSDKFCMVECVVPPGLGAPPNCHAGETEVFFVLDGTLEFMVSGETIRAKVGDSVRIPDGAVQAFTAKGLAPARVLIIVAPGHMHEGFFTELGSSVDDDRTEPAPLDGPPAWRMSSGWPINGALPSWRLRLPDRMNEPDRVNPASPL